MPRPVRDVFVGGGAKGTAALGHYAPGLTDTVMEKGVIPGTESGKPPIPPERMNLDNPSEDPSERGGYPGRVFETSAYTRAVLNPPVNAFGGFALVGAGLLAGALLGASRNAAAGRGVHRPVHFAGEEGSTTTKALHMRPEARPGKAGGGAHRAVERDPRAAGGDHAARRARAQGGRARIVTCGPMTGGRVGRRAGEAPSGAWAGTAPGRAWTWKSVDDGA